MRPHVLVLVLMGEREKAGVDLMVDVWYELVRAMFDIKRKFPHLVVGKTA